MTKALIGNIFETNMLTLVNTVNCVGVMGKGVAKEFKQRYPQMFEDYKRRCDLAQLKVGEPYYYEDMTETSIVNFPTKDHWRSSSKISDIIQGLDIFLANYQAWGIKSIAFPPLGCGNGGLEWDLVGPLMYQRLMDLPIDVEIYAPFGTPAKKLTEKFLRTDVEFDFLEEGARAATFNPEWLALIEVLKRLEQQKYSNPVGRTIFQKICYIMTELGTETGFKFKKGSYGPFSSEIKSAMSYFANSNLVKEKQLGPMTALLVDDSYSELLKKHEHILKNRGRAISKTVDLFSRIKNTDQAEEITTVLYASREIKVREEKASEQQLIDYVLEWKKSWNNEEKLNSIATTMRNLEMLSWLKLDYSESISSTPV